MIRPLLSSETLHASTVAIGGRGVAILGRSGLGKSDLALRLIDRGAVLVSDDYTLVKRQADDLVATAPATIAGRMEIRGIGIVEVASVAGAPVALLVDLDLAGDRMPSWNDGRTVLGVEVPVIALSAGDASAAIKVELALRLHGRGRSTA